MAIVRVAFTAEETFDLARVYLNDQNVQLWDDNLLMPMMYIAHLELQTKLKSRAAPIMKGFSEQVLNPYQTELSAVIADLVLPIQIWEKPLGAPQLNYQLMTETDVLPILPPSGALTWWSWSQEILNFIGSTIANEVLVIYWRRLPIPTDVEDSIGIIDGELYLAPRIAAIAAASVGEEQTSSVMAAQALASFTEIMQANRGRSPQNVSTSIRP